MEVLSFLFFSDWAVGHCGSEPPQDRQRCCTLRPQLLLFYHEQPGETAKHYVQVSQTWICVLFPPLLFLIYSLFEVYIYTKLSMLLRLICFPLSVPLSYVWEHLEVGYVQGMCDLLAPLMVILDDGEFISLNPVLAGCWFNRESLYIFLDPHSVFFLDIEHVAKNSSICYLLYYICRVLK